MKQDLKFLRHIPTDFLWGAASAAYQVEGAYNIEGKDVSIWDEWTKLPGKTFQNTNGDIATDHYHRYKEDVRLMKEMGLKTYRFSISWTRILNGTEINPKGILFYHNLIDECQKHGIEPMVTLYHWDLPKRLQDQYGGWLSDQIVDDFVAYAKVCFDAYHTKVKKWIVINEPNIFTHQGYELGVHPPGHKDKTDEYLKAFHHTALAHAKTVNLYKSGSYEKGMIGSSIALTPGFSQTDSPKDLEATKRYMDLNFYWFTDIYYKGSYPKWALEYYQNNNLIKFSISDEQKMMLTQAAKEVDFIGINYYQSTMIAHNPLDGVGQVLFNTDGKKTSFVESGIPGVYKNVENPNVTYTNWNWVVDPDGLKETLKVLTKRYHLPIIISENGLGAFDEIEDGAIHDDYRIDFIYKHIKALAQSIQEGSDVLAYCVWSFTDLLSWLNGYQKRYGFVHVDFESPNLTRRKKDSFYWYQHLIQYAQNKKQD